MASALRIGALKTMVATSCPLLRIPALTRVEDFTSLIGERATDRILAKAGRLADFHITHINSTYYGGGVAQLLGSLTLLMNLAGIKTEWRVIEGRPDFFSITKKMHNAAGR